MNQQRYQKLIAYKAALDSEWQRRNPVGIHNDAYETTLYQAKMDSFKVLRNSKGEHKLIDTLADGQRDFTDSFNMLFGGLFNK